MVTIAEDGNQGKLELRNEIKEAQGVSKSRRLMGAVFHFDLWRKNQQILVD
jgi:hypothetical protein